MANQTETGRDPFSDVEGDDPFAESTPTPEQDQTVEETNAEEEAAMGDTEIQTVDREGEPVEAQPVTSAETDAPPVTGPVETPVEPQEQAQEPQSGTEGDQGTAEAADDASESEPETPASGTGPRGGSSPLRNYKILYETASGQWTEVKLDPENSPDGVTVVTLKDEEKGTEDQWVEARNNDHALRIGYVLLGRPDQGARILPIPHGGWKARLVRKAPPRPERERLEIG